MMINKNKKIMKFAIALAFTAFKAYSETIGMDEKFLQYMATNNKTYATQEEFEKRFGYFTAADTLI